MDVIKISLRTFLFLLILGVFIVNTDAARCCLSYTRRPVRCGRLSRYYMQELTGTCDIRAVVFQTRDGKHICADPRMEWTQERITCLWEKAAIAE